MKRRAFDPELEAILPLLPAISDLSSLEKVLEMRAGAASLSIPAPVRDDVTKEDRRVPGPSGAPDGPLRIYRPSRHNHDSDSHCPAMLEIHGGGFLMGSIEMMDPWCQQVAATIDAVVVRSTGARSEPGEPARRVHFNDGVRPASRRRNSLRAAPVASRRVCRITFVPRYLPRLSARADRLGLEAGNQRDLPCARAETRTADKRRQQRLNHESITRGVA